MAQSKKMGGKTYKAYGFRFTKREAKNLASSLRKDYKSVRVVKEVNRKGATIYVVYYRK